MAPNRTTASLTLACVLSLLLVACPKKGGDAADGGASDAAPVTSATASASAPDTAADSGPLATATATTAKPVAKPAPTPVKAEPQPCIDLRAAKAANKPPPIIRSLETKCTNAGGTP